MYILFYMRSHSYTTPTPNSSSTFLLSFFFVFSQYLHVFAVFFPPCMDGDNDDDDDDDDNTNTNCCASTFYCEGALGSVVGNPFDVLKTRMMTAEGTLVHLPCALYLFCSFFLFSTFFFFFHLFFVAAAGYS